ncbi:(Fe-S)-binding protein [Radiobacillus sp. PE A8.2]|uniref:(Fe-S)-binding protein n=1 Tax=Radiobacillus sp. PE A8.2 TaxID=3380349 RepID=UPI00388ED78B
MNGWLIANWILFTTVTIYGIYLFIRVVSTRVAYIKLGRKATFDRKLKERLMSVLVNVFGQKKLLKDKKSGIIHVMMFYGFILVQFGAIDFIYKGLVPEQHLPFGALYPAFTFFQEIVTLTILVAVCWAFHRRYVEKLARLKRGFKSGHVLLFIATLMLSVLLGNGFQLVLHEQGFTWTEPIASVFASAFYWVPSIVASVLFYAAWWIHLLALLSFLVYVPQSKHAHLLAAPVNVLLSRQTPVGKLEKINFDIDEAEAETASFGVGRIEEFTQLQMIDFYACVECGRCTNVCPATSTGKVLSPMHLITKLRDHLTNTGAAVTGKSPWVPAVAFANTEGNQLAKHSRMSETSNQEVAASLDTLSQTSMIGDVITEEELWACTTCRNCEDQCPVMNEHVDKIIDLRRYLVLTEGRVDPDAQRAMMNIERQGNPWGLSKREREQWREQDPSVEIPTVKEMKKEGREFEYLFWVGSMGAYDNRSQKIAMAFAKLMNQAGISFAILGNKEVNSGDTARRLGNEFLFQELAEKNIKEFEKHEVKKIVTIDPHAYNIFKNEYPDFGFEAEVYHHTQVLYDWIMDGRIKPEQSINETITYHDSCYLGRYNGVYDPPREIFKQIPGIRLVEMARSKENAMCCGAGGGMMWMEEKTGTRVNVERTEQAMRVNPSMISSACPYCLTMLSDGTKAKEVEDDISTMDVAEVLALSVFSDITEQPA